MIRQTRFMKRILACAVATTLAFGSVPVSTFADDIISTVGNVSNSGNALDESTSEKKTNETEIKETTESIETLESTDVKSADNLDAEQFSEEETIEDGETSGRIPKIKEALGADYSLDPELKESDIEHLKTAFDDNVPQDVKAFFNSHSDEAFLFYDIVGANSANDILATVSKKGDKFTFYFAPLNSSSSGIIPDFESLEYVNGNIEDFKDHISFLEFEFEHNTGNSRVNAAIINSIDSIVIDEGIVTVGDYACWGMSGKLSLPSTLVNIKDYAFAKTKTGDITIPDSVKTIGKYAFDSFNNYNNMSISLGSGVESIGEGAFYAVNVNNGKITISIDSLAHWMNIDFADEFANPLSTGYGMLYDSINGPQRNPQTTSFAVNGEEIKGTLFIPSTTTAIKKYAFVTIPEDIGAICVGKNVTSIGDQALKLNQSSANVYIYSDSCTIADDSDTVGGSVRHYIADSTFESWLDTCNISNKSEIRTYQNRDYSLELGYSNGKSLVGAGNENNIGVDEDGNLFICWSDEAAENNGLPVENGEYVYNLYYFDTNYSYGPGDSANLEKFNTWIPVSIPVDGVSKTDLPEDECVTEGTGRKIVIAKENAAYSKLFGNKIRLEKVRLNDDFGFNLVQQYTYFDGLEPVAQNEENEENGPSITSITCDKIKTLTATDNSRYNGITQEIGTEVEYEYTLNPSEQLSEDELSVSVETLTGNAENPVIATIDTDNKKITIKTPKNEWAYEKTCKVTVTNDTTNASILEFFVTTTNPSWVNVKPTFSFVSATDTNVLFNVALPKGVDEEDIDDSYYYELCITGEKGSVLSKNGIELRTATGYYFPVKNGDKIVKQISFYPFRNILESGTETESDVIKTAGKGYGTNFAAQLKLVRIKEGTLDGEDIGNYRYVQSAKAGMATLSGIKTKNPYYADSISLKNTNTNVYSGQTKIKIATIDFGKNASFITRADWEAEIPTALELDEVSPTNEYDNGLYINVPSTTAPGTYTITVKTKTSENESNNPAVAKINVKVLETIQNLSVSAPAKVYKKSTSTEASFTTKVVADTGYVYSSEPAVIKSPKIEYVLQYASGDEGLEDSELGTEEHPWINVDKKLVSIDKNGKVTVKKNCPYKYIKVIVKTADFDRASSGCAELSKEAIVRIVSSGINVKKNSIVVKDLDGNTVNSVPFNKLTNITWEANINGETVSFNGVNPASFTPSDDYTVSITPDLTKLTAVPSKPGSIKMTIKGIDGTSAVKSINYTYSADSEGNAKKYDSIYLADANGTPIYADVDETTYLEKNTFTRPATSPSSELMDVCLYSGIYGCANVTKGDTDVLDKDFVDGKITISNAKIVKNENNQHLQFYLTKSPATVTLIYKDGSKKVTKTWKIINKNLEQKKSAPTASLKQPGKIYANYDYNSQELEVKLNSQIPDFNKAVVVESMSSPELISILDTNSIVYEPYVEGSGKKAKNVASLSIPFMSGDNVKLAKTGTYKLAFDFYNSSNEPLTKAPAVVTIKADSFKKNFALATSYTISALDQSQIPFKMAKNTGVESVVVNSIMNSNEKGTYTKFTGENGYFDLSDDDMSTDNVDGMLVLKSIPVNGKINGYVSGTVNYSDGTSQTFTTKITVNVVNVAKSYSADSMTILQSQAVEQKTAYNVMIKGNKQNTELAYVSVDQNDAITKSIVSAVSVNDENKSGLDIKFSGEGCKEDKSYKLKFKVVPKGFAANSVLISLPDNERTEFIQQFGIPVTVSLSVKKNNYKGKFKLKQTSVALVETEEGLYTGTVDLVSTLSIPSELQGDDDSTYGKYYMTNFELRGTKSNGSYGPQTEGSDFLTTEYDRATQKLTIILHENQGEFSIGGGSDISWSGFRNYITNFKSVNGMTDSRKLVINGFPNEIYTMKIKYPKLQ